MKAIIPPLHQIPILIQWLIFIVLALASGGLLEYAQVPAGLLLGPMICAIIMGIQGAKIRMPSIGFKTSQGFVGALVAHSMSLSLLTKIVDIWPLMLVITLITLILSVLVGILSVRFGGLPGSTAAWGTSPGGAAAMMAMSEEYGADVRVVATMQYTRVICVVLMAAAICHILGTNITDDVQKIARSSIIWNQTTLINFILTLAIIAVGVTFGRFLPSGALLLPMILGSVCQVFNWVDIVVPHSLLIIVYGAIGAYIGLRFDRESLRYVMYAIPVMLSASILLIVLCAISGLGVSYYLGVDYLSAYLATSPGGLDSLSIIAIDVNADVGLVVSMQTLRLFAVILTGPMLAKFTARFAIEK